jgi:hypothetical protein
MKKSILFSFFIIALLTFPSCDALQQVSQTVGPPTESEMVAGLKEALQVGTGNAASFLNKPGGYLDNPRFKIPLPPDVQNVADKLRQLGLGSQVDEFLTRMNRGAEDAAMEAKPIFLNAVTSMTISDAKNILLGSNNAATQYFQGKTRDALYIAFSPHIKSSLDKFQVTKYWTQITSTYNKIPLVKPIETDLIKYSTNKALDGLFLKLSDEEKDIRNNLNARTTALLQKVFGWAAMQK